MTLTTHDRLIRGLAEGLKPVRRLPSHPYDAAATDLSVHAAAVTLVIVANRALSGRIFSAVAFTPIDVTEAPVAPK
jgi:hypothetical protein